MNKLKKIMIASDLHGSSFYVEKMLDAYKRENCDTLILLGDLLYHGPRNDLPNGYEVKKVAEILNSIANEIIAVRGNCDGEVDQHMLDFPIMQDNTIINIDNYNFFATHGHIYNENNLPKFKGIDVLLNGHFHVPCFKRYENYVYVNCGSVSIPKQNSCHSAVIYEDKKFKFLDLLKDAKDMIYREDSLVEKNM